MSYFLEYVTDSYTHSLRGGDAGGRSSGGMRQNQHRLGRLSVLADNILMEEEEEEDDDSALIEHVPLTPTTSTDYGATRAGENNNNNNNNRTSMGFTDGYVDWSHSNDSMTNAFGAFFGYIVVAILGYSFVFENWSILDSMYFAVTVFTTVGYGDLAPSTDISRIFTMLFASCGIILLGVFLGIIGARLYELREERVNVKLQGVQKRVMTQFDDTQQHTRTSSGEVEVVITDDDDTANEQGERQQDDTNKKGQEGKESFANDLWEIIKIETPLILALVMLASPVVYFEGWDFVMGLYWMFVTGTTIGFGDLSPTHTWTKVICIIYLPLAAAVFGEMLAQIAGAYIERCSDEIEDAFLDRALEKGDLEKMDLDNNDIVKPYEFLSYMLVTLGKAETEDINEILELFRKLDTHNDGYLSKNTLAKRYNLKAKPSLRRKNADRHLNILPGSLA